MKVPHPGICGKTEVARAGHVPVFPLGRRAAPHREVAMVMATSYRHSWPMRHMVWPASSGTTVAFTLSGSASSMRASFSPSANRVTR